MEQHCLICIWCSQNCIYQCPHTCSCRPIQTFCHWNRCFRLCIGSCLITTRIWPRPTTNCLLFRKFTPAKIKYEIYDKELWAIITTFEEWQHYRGGGQHKTQVFCDHKNLQQFMTTRILNHRQAQWSILLPNFDFKEDILSQWVENVPKGGDRVVAQKTTPLLKPNQVQL